MHPIDCDWITIQTANNAFSGALDGTLISAGSQLYEQLSRLSVGQRVIVSGRFRSSDQDYLREASLTEAGSMNEPEFLFAFASVRTPDR